MNNYYDDSKNNFIDDKEVKSFDNDTENKRDILNSIKLIIEETVKNLEIKCVEKSSDEVENKKSNVLGLKCKNIAKIILEALCHTVELISVSILVSFIIFFIYSFCKELNMYNEIKSSFIENTLYAYFENMAGILILPILVGATWKIAKLLKVNKTRLTKMYEIKVNVPQDFDINDNIDMTEEMDELGNKVEDEEKNEIEKGIESQIKDELKEEKETKIQELQTAENEKFETTNEQEVETLDFKNQCKYDERKDNYADELEQIKNMCTNEDKETIAQLVNEILDEYKSNPESQVYFDFTTKTIKLTKKYIGPRAYTKYIKILVSNLENYPSQGLEILKNIKNTMPDNISKELLHKANKIVNKDIYEDYYQILKKNSDCFYEEKEDLSEYVRFLVDNIGLSENPTEIIQELDENFNRISKVYDLNRNIKNLENLDYDVAYEFLAKCLDNGPLDRMIIDVNDILEDADGAEDCLKIERKMKNYNLMNVIESDVKNLENSEELYSYNILRNLLVICANKKEDVKAEEVVGILKAIFCNVENTDDAQDINEIDNVNNDDNIDNVNNIDNTDNIDDIINIDNADKTQEKFNIYNNKEYVFNVYEILNQFDRTYFFDLRKEFINILYTCFHNTNIDELRLSTLECAKYFRLTLLLRNRLNEEELKFYIDNK